MPNEWDRDAFGSITLSNSHAQEIVSNLEELIDLSVATNERRKISKFAVWKFNVATVIMRQKRDYTCNDIIISFQSNVDVFFQAWVQPHSHSGCTNYNHMLSSGHIAEYMFRWCSLNCFSQQGWDHLNSLLINPAWWPCGVQWQQFTNWSNKEQAPDHWSLDQKKNAMDMRHWSSFI
jgi:hypothetical protein